MVPWSDTFSTPAVKVLRAATQAISSIFQVLQFSIRNDMLSNDSCVSTNMLFYVIKVY
jgi:hypothetical protein